MAKVFFRAWDVVMITIPLAIIEPSLLEEDEEILSVGSSR
jgi:hypothetical protein